jgi:hypothetical protein
MLSNILKDGLVFGLLGQAIGLVTIAVPAVAMESDWSAGALFLMLPTAYLIGGIPALVTGLLVGMARPRLRGIWAYLLAALIGTLCSVLYLIAVTGGDLDLRQIGFLAALPSFAASFVCGYIFLKPPKSSLDQGR